MSELFFRSNRPGYPHQVCSQLENGGFRVAVGDCSVTERRRWCPPYQTSKTVSVHANTLQTRLRRMHGVGVRGHGSVPLSQSGNIVMRIGLHTHCMKHPAYFDWVCIQMCVNYNLLSICNLVSQSTKVKLCLKKGGGLFIRVGAVTMIMVKA